MKDDLCTAERWRQNVPCTDRPFTWKPLRTALLSFGALVVLLIAVAIARGGPTHDPITLQAERPSRPHMVLFSHEGCGPCQALIEDFHRGAFPGMALVVVKHGTGRYEQWLNELSRTIPVDPHGRTLNPTYVGPLSVRPRDLPVPAVWIPGSREIWVGYRPADRRRLSAWLALRRPKALPPPERYRRSPHDRRTIPSILGQSEGYLASDDDRFDDPPAGEIPVRDFDGVAVIVTLPELSEEHKEERAALAHRVDRALQELVKQMLGAKVRAFFVARVADPETYDRVASVTGMARDGPVVHLLIPERFRGMKAFLVRRVEAALEEHFLSQIRAARVNVVLERLHGGTYEAALAAVANRPGPASGEDVPLSQLFFYLLSAWLGERSDLARRILERMQRRKAVA